VTAKRKASPARSKATDTPFLTDVTTLRPGAQADRSGTGQDTYGADLARVLEVLNTSLATELVCVLRHKAHHHGAKGLNAEPIAAEFLEHAGQEQVHADRIAST